MKLLQATSIEASFKIYSIRSFVTIKICNSIY